MLHVPVFLAKLLYSYYISCLYYCTKQLEGFHLRHSNEIITFVGVIVEFSEFVGRFFHIPNQTTTTISSINYDDIGTLYQVYTQGISQGWSIKQDTSCISV